ncbi:uncharacterized protein LOC135708865 [Ochlerotatus camptorhynchus]|uniref:uncharacterized protein LOC135708865 n=1 Tax=Ochlerotatus camptorhynchus TaxID=644619 RepID=UPI0031D4A579
MGVSGDGLLVSLSLPTQCLVFSAEAVAILYVVKLPVNRPILVVTDSHSVILALTTRKHPWIQGTVKHAPSNTVSMWVPGHCGVQGNVTADHLAGSGHTRPRFTGTVSLQDVKKWIKRTVRRAWDTEWRNNRTYHLRKIKATTGTWKDRPNLREQRVVSRLCTGHSRVSHNFGGTPFRRICETCGVPATVEHILVNCAELKDLWAAFGLESSIIRNLLGDESPAAAALITFLKEANFYNNI